MPSAVVGTPFSLQLSVTVGVRPYEWTTPLGALPPGLSFDIASGTITGTPSAEGTFNSNLRVGDHSEQHANLSLQIKVFRS